MQDLNKTNHILYFIFCLKKEIIYFEIIGVINWRDASRRIRNLSIRRALHCPVLMYIYPRRTLEKPRQSDKVNEPPPPIFIHVTNKNARVLVFTSFLSPESRNAMMHFERLVA